MLKKIGKFFYNNALIIALAFIPPLVIWYFLQRENTELTVTLNTNIPVVSLQEKYSKDIEVFYQSTPVKSLNIKEISVENTGNTPIEKEDFDSPVEFIYQGSVLNGPAIVNKDPNSLQPKLNILSKDTVSLKPLLLNEGDKFSFRTYVANSLDNNEEVKVNARIANLKDVTLQKAGTSENGEIPQFLLGIISALLASISIYAFYILGKRARSIVVTFPFGLAIELTEQLQSKGKTATKAKEIASRLEISKHNYKNNLLLLRIKMEGLLREIAHALDLPKREQFGGISRLSKTLYEKSIVPQEVTAAIHDISPAMNRELHESESYLDKDEYEVLQNLSLNVIANLEEIRDDVVKDSSEGAV